VTPPAKTDNPPDPLQSFLRAAGNLLWAHLDQQLCILDCNAAFRRHMHLAEIPVGTPLIQFLKVTTDDQDPAPLPSREEPVLNVLHSYSNDAAYFGYLFHTPTGYSFLAEVGVPSSMGVVETMTHLSNQQAQLNRKLRQNNLELRRALEEVKTLQGLIPICCYCKSIRDDQGVWNRLEQYIAQHSNADFSHGICPDCLRNHYPQQASRILRDHQSTA